MRFLLPFVSVCLLAPASVQPATAAGPQNATKPPAHGRQVDASFFLEEVKPGSVNIKAQPATGKNATTVIKQPSKVIETKANKASILESAQTQAPSKHFQQGLMMQSMGMHANAIAEYKDALKDDPKFISTYNNLAQCLVYRNDPGDKEEALRLLGEAQKIAPTNVGTLHALAVLKESNKDYEGAEATYKKVIAIQPLNQRAIQNLAEIHYRLGNKEKARAVILDAMKHNPPEQQVAIFKAALINLEKDPKELAKEMEKQAADAKKQADAEKQATDMQAAETKAAMAKRAAEKAAKTAATKESIK
ncbi:MAG: tetratricopeptide repeat protein [Candidatus Melainabacteria bacterium]|nr:tetratricopeptide repeat protein [Candidatus Melainabacteria bacterium]